MVQRPRPDLRGGCAAMRIPTVTGGRGSVTTPFPLRFNLLAGWSISSTMWASFTVGSWYYGACAWGFTSRTSGGDGFLETRGVAVDFSARTFQRQEVRARQHKHAAGRAVEHACARAIPQVSGNLAGKGGKQNFNDDFDADEGAGHDEELGQEAMLGGVELRQEGGKKDDRLRIHDGDP